MEQSTFKFRFTGILLILGVVMVNLGNLLIPVNLQNSFIISSFLDAHSNERIWIWSFRFLVFGLFIEVMGLEALRSLFKESGANAVISSGIIVSILAWLVMAITQGYFMHMGAWAGWKISTLEPALQNSFLQTLDATHEWVVCLSRMAYMFFGLGMIAVGWGFLRDTLFPKWLGMYTLVFGMAGILFMMIFESRTDIYTPVCWGISLFIALTGILLLKRK